MARPVWHDAGHDPHAIADLLAGHAEAKGAVSDLAARPGADGRRGLHQAAILVAQRQLALRHGDQDRILAQEVRAIDDLVKTGNLLVERLREWYGMHAPEATRALAAEKLAGAVADHGDRAAVMQAAGLAQDISVGTDLAPEDLIAVQAMASAARSVHDTWHLLERRVDALMEEVAPNLAVAVGPLLGARMIAQAGSLERLAGFPAGTMQTLGAEEALFRHLKQGTKPPKHGILFQHPAVHQAPPWQRGAAAKALARLALIASRADAFTGRDVREELSRQWAEDQTRIKAIEKPVRGPRGPKGPKGPRGRGPSKGPSGPRGKKRGPPSKGKKGKQGGPRRDGGPAAPPRRHGRPPKGGRK